MSPDPKHVPDRRGRPTAQELVARLSAIEDIRQRSLALAQRLRKLSNEDVCEVITAIRERAASGDRDAIRLYNGLLVSGMLAEVLGNRRMSELVETAQREEKFEIVAILVDIPPETPEDIPFQPFLDPGLRETPLGMRKALARRPDFRLIKRIARDQDHRVIRILLNNPRLTEMDVTRIASTRPASPKVLEEIYNHPRWIHRHSVKKVIVLNPYTPLSLGLRLLTFMRLQDLEEICASSDLNSVLLREARHMMAKKMRCFHKAEDL